MNGTITEGGVSPFTNNGQVTSLINLAGGRLNVNEGAAEKLVDTLNFGDGAGTDTVGFTVLGGGVFQTLKTTNTVVGLTGAVVDLTTVAPDAAGGIAASDMFTLISGDVSGGTVALDPGDVAN